MTTTARILSDVSNEQTVYVRSDGTEIKPGWKEEFTSGSIVIPTTSPVADGGKANLPVTVKIGNEI